MRRRVVHIEYPGGVVGSGVVVGDDEVDIEGWVVTLLERHDVIVVDGERREVLAIAVEGGRPAGLAPSGRPPRARLLLRFPEQD